MHSINGNGLIKSNMKNRFSINYYTFSLLLMMSLSIPVRSEENSTSALKVAYIYNIAKFTHWPSATWNTSVAPFILCAYGDDDVSKDLINLQSKKIDEHSINVVKVKNDQDYQQCNAFYIKTDDNRLYRYLLSRIDLQTVLTITDDSPFFDSGGFVNLVQKNNRLRFQISNQQLSSTKLVLSSKLLKLSILVD
jgi:hypothetical protein